MTYISLLFKSFELAQVENTVDSWKEVVEGLLTQTIYSSEESVSNVEPLTEPSSILASISSTMSNKQNLNHTMATAHNSAQVGEILKNIYGWSLKKNAGMSNVASTYYTSPQGSTFKGRKTLIVFLLCNEMICRTKDDPLLFHLNEEKLKLHSLIPVGNAGLHSTVQNHVQSPLLKRPSGGNSQKEHGYPRKHAKAVYSTATNAPQKPLPASSSESTNATQAPPAASLSKSANAPQIPPATSLSKSKNVPQIPPAASTSKSANAPQKPRADSLLKSANAPKKPNVELGMDDEALLTSDFDTDAANADADMDMGDDAVNAGFDMYDARDYHNTDADFGGVEADESANAPQNPSTASFSFDSANITQIPHDASSSDNVNASSTSKRSSVGLRRATISSSTPNLARTAAGPRRASVASSTPTLTPTEPGHEMYLSQIFSKYLSRHGFGKCLMKGKLESKNQYVFPGSTKDGVEGTDYVVGDDVFAKYLMEKGWIVHSGYKNLYYYTGSSMVYQK